MACSLLAMALAACRRGASPAPRPGSRATPGTKRGIAYGFRSQSDLAAVSPQASWWYNWSYRPGSALPGAEFVPMALTCPPPV